MMEKLIGKKNCGQSVLETLVALAILAISVLSGFILIYNSQSFSVDVDLGQQAIYLAQKGLETARYSAKNNFNDLVGSSSITGNFTQETIIENIDAYSKKIISRTSWKTDLLRPQKIELTTLVTSRSNIIGSGGDAGGSAPFGDWKNPKTLGSIDLGAGESATDLDVKNKMVYLTAEASDKKKSDFFIVNATDGQNPFIVSSLNVGDGLKGVDVAGNYAYVVGKDDDKEFIVIDVSNQSAPIEVASLNLSGSADALTIFYWNGYVYVGRASGSSQEFLIIDVSNPLAPSLVSGLSGVGNEINDIYVLNNRVYLGTEDSSRGMIVINVASSTSPSVLGSIDVGDHVYGIYPRSENQVLVGEKTKFYIVNASSTSKMAILGSASIGSKTRDIVSSGSLAFLATEDSNKEFQVYDISSSTRPSFWSSFNFPQIATGIDYEDNIVYVSVRSNDALRIITSQ
ncbi:hypothetical protein HZC33_01330 [Candidatus Wolfebacteria bacterium]|nr:hypothetical protein [Candidatus Wolfebacteria bacterium]